MHWFPLTLICAFTLASSDALVKRYLSTHRTGELVIIRFGLASILAAPFLLQHSWPDLNTDFWRLAAFCIPLELIAVWLYIRALQSSPLSLTLPYLAFTPVFTVLTGYWFLGESISAVGFVGVALVVGGTWLLNLQSEQLRQGWRGMLQPFLAIIREPGSRYMLIVAVIYSLTAVISKGMAQDADPHLMGLFYYTLVGWATLIVFGRYLPGTLQVVRKQPIATLAVSLTMLIMVVTHFMAIVQVEAAYMIAVKRTSLLFGMVYGALWFAEEDLRRKLLAGSLMISGVFLIGF